MSVPTPQTAVQAFCSGIFRRIVVGGALMHCLLIVSLGVAIYADTFRVPFVFDDIPCIAENPALESYFDHAVPDGRRFAGMQPDIINSMHLRSVTYLTFALNYRFNGLDVAGYHGVNLLIHLATALLVYLFVAAILKTPFFSGHPAGREFRQTLPLVVALLFVCHPIQTSAVTYTVQRFTSLATLFYLLSLLLYLKARTAGGVKPRIALLAGSTAIAVLGMYTKEILFTLPVMAVICELLFLRGSLGMRVKSLFPLLCTMLIIPVNTISKSDAVGGVLSHMDDSINLANLTDVSQLEYLCTQFRVIVTYLRLLLLPIDQHLDYDYPRYQTILEPAVLASLFLLICIASSGVWACHRSRAHSPDASAERLYAFGVAWFFITISMSSSIIPLDDMIFEYRLYLPSTGFFIAVASVALLARRRVEMAGLWPIRMPAAAMVVMMVVLALANATYARNRVWGTEVRLWEDNVEKAPDKARPHFNLGNAYIYEHRFIDAIAQNYEAVRLAPTRGLKHGPWFNIARCLEELKKWDEALEAYEIALQIKPYDYRTLTWYARLLATVGRHQESRQQLEFAERLSAADYR